MIGILCALESEYTAVLNILSEKKKCEGVLCPVVTGKVFDREVTVTQSGIGMVNAATAVMVLQQYATPKWILNIGFSGILNPTYAQGDAILCSNVCSYDSDAFGAGSLGWSDPYLEGYSIYPEVLLVLKEEGLDTKVNLRLGRAASGDRIVTNAELAEKIRTTYEADCVDMETAAVCQTCLKLRIPHAVVRILSDYSNKRAYIDFLKKEKELLALIEDLSKVMVKVKDKV